MKKKIAIVFALLLIICSLFGCAKSATENKEAISSTVTEKTISQTDDKTVSKSAQSSSKYVKSLVPVKSDSKVLIVYFSVTGTIAQVADYIRETTGGAMFELSPFLPYTNDDVDYSNEKCRSNVEYKDAHARVEIDALPSNINDYDTIYLGYPIWYGDAPKIIYTFLENVDVSGKTVIPFCTSQSTGIETSIKNIKAVSPKAKWKSGKRFAPSATQKDIDMWIN